MSGGRAADGDYPPHPRDDLAALYDGGRLLGRLVADPGCGVHAQLADGRDLGRFTTHAAAGHAVLAAAALRGGGAQ